MTETKMPAAEANEVAVDEKNSYELAFHVLPTVAEGEVAGVYEKIKALITKDGEITTEEAPERTDLAYPVVKPMDGKNRKFTSAYFGWVRFKFDADKIEHLDEEVGVIEEILRHLFIKLTKQDEAEPFRFHEEKKSVKMVEVVGEKETLDEVKTEKEEEAPVSEKELDESLEKLTSDDENKESDSKKEEAKEDEVKETKEGVKDAEVKEEETKEEVKEDTEETKEK